MGDVPPNQTLYVNNLNERIKSHGEAPSFSSSSGKRHCLYAKGAGNTCVILPPPASLSLSCSFCLACPLSFFSVSLFFFFAFVLCSFVVALVFVIAASLSLSPMQRWSSPLCSSSLVFFPLFSFSLLLPFQFPFTPLSPLHGYDHGARRRQPGPPGD